MGSKTTTTNTVDWKRRNDTPDMIEARNAARDIDWVSPLITRQKQDERELTDTVFDDDNLNESAKSKIRFGRLFDLRTRNAAQLAETTGAQEQAKSANLMNIANANQDQLYNSGSTQRTSPGALGIISSILGPAIGLAGMAATGGASGAIGAAGGGAAAPAGM